ncbi:3-ketoacyl-ACP reductase [Parapedobacter sp. 10938]|uniref:3-ketoacyl-ACP reductase n=1 Tax=Parapedobacter flavus TaxID=3110225 RepID=UPI002DBFD5B0|nr:3-ketoacyl-ACP reductase [Parapedobacter sp. 10938]MEC3878492.1 3-ketoacyl-ACP reductase [Parapedobacter sp. 10938]
MKKIALVTGGSRGIGLGIARSLAGAGFDLAINGMRDEKDVVLPLEELRQLGADVIYCRGDVGDADARARIIDQVKAHFGQLNVLVNNAGVAPKERKDILEATEESFDDVIRTNLTGPYFLSQAAANWMVEQKVADPAFEASIINISSISATVVSTNRGEYCVGKAGMSMATQLFAARLGEYYIPVYEVRPGVIATDMTAKVTEKYDKLIADGLCVLPRWGLPEDVGKAVAALATGNFPYTTGQVIMVDGAMNIPRL